MHCIVIIVGAGSKSHVARVDLDINDYISSYVAASVRKFAQERNVYLGCHPPEHCEFIYFTSKNIIETYC